MSKAINVRIAILEAVIGAALKVNTSIDRAQAWVRGGIDTVQASAIGALNARLDKLVADRAALAAKVETAPHTKFYQIHDQLAELRAQFAEESQRLLTTAQAEIEPEKIAKAQDDAKAIRDEAAALAARKK